MLQSYYFSEKLQYSKPCLPQSTVRNDGNDRNETMLMTDSNAIPSNGLDCQNPSKHIRLYKSKAI